MFDYDGYGTKVSTLEPYRGKVGWLTLKLVSVEALGNQEQHLLVAASTADGLALAEDDPEKLLRLPATTRAASPLWYQHVDVDLSQPVATTQPFRPGGIAYRDHAKKLWLGAL